MAEFPSLPLFTDALLGDTQHLSQAEFGAYMLTLIVAWRSPGCCLPNDDRYLARITRSERNWARIKPAVMAFWTLGIDGQWRQKRLSYEHLAAADLRSQRSEAGKSSALKRRERLKTSAEAVLQRKANENLTPNPNPTKKEPEADASGKKARTVKTTIDPEFQPDETSRRYALKLGYNPDDITPEFVNFWVGDGGRKSNWQATYRNRCDQITRSRGFNRSGQRSSAQGGGSVVRAAMAVIAANSERGLRADGIPGSQAPDGYGAGGDSFAFESFDEAGGAERGNAGTDQMPVGHEIPRKAG